MERSAWGAFALTLASDVDPWTEQTFLPLRSVTLLMELSPFFTMMSWPAM